jgi:beta-phosphoglucomutase-like phosphatase (HAD superfamily)
VLRAIVFDFDGVIANSEPLHFGAFRDVLATEGVTLTERDYYARYLGYDDVGVFKAVDAARGVWGRRTSRAGREQGGAARGARARRLGALSRARRRHAGARGSDADRDRVRRPRRRDPARARARALAGCFTAIVAAEDTPVSKPAPDPYLRAVALLAALRRHARAADCVAIEDSRWGLESARAAGMRTVAVTNTYEASALAGAADLVIDRWRRSISPRCRACTRSAKRLP